MKKFAFFFLSLISLSVAAQEPGTVCSVVTCPGEDVSTSINVSWAAALDVTDSYVKYAEASDSKWSKAVCVRPVIQEYCTAFDGFPSADENGREITENARFLKCGASLEGLKPDKEYKYVICRGSEFSKKAASLSAEHHFKTAGAPQWSCCIISDFHNYPPLRGRLKSAVGMIDTVNAYDPSMDWILHLGDICAWGGSWSFWKELYSTKPFENFMWAGVNGNHDNMTRKYAKTSNEFFRNAAFYPRNGYRGEEGVCYHFRYGEVMFVMLNNENMRSEQGLLEAQRWVKKVVTEQQQSANPPKYVIVCEHYQWFFGGEGQTSQYGRWHELFDELGVDLALAGNNHIYLRTDAVFDDHVTDGASGTVYVQTSSSDNERGQGMKDDLKYNQDKIRCRFTEGGRTVSAINMKADASCLKLALLDRNGRVLDEAVIRAKSAKAHKTDIRGNYFRDSLGVFTARCQKTLDAAYMAGKLLGTNECVPGWEGYPVKMWEYWTGPDKVTGQPKKGLVYMLNPDACKLATWIINAVYDVTGDVRYDDLEKVRQYIMWQSGAQFPVKGVVYEDMYGTGYYPYIFKDGVTVYMADEAKHKSADNNPGEELLQFYLNMDNTALKDYTGRFARICSTTREMYYAAGGTEDVGLSDDGKRSLHWLDVVADLYKQAWNSDRNPLIYAWALDRLK